LVGRIIYNDIFGNHEKIQISTEGRKHLLNRKRNRHAEPKPVLDLIGGSATFGGVPSFDRLRMTMYVAQDDGVRVQDDDARVKVNATPGVTLSLSLPST